MHKQLLLVHCKHTRAPEMPDHQWHLQWPCTFIVNAAVPVTDYILLCYFLFVCFYFISLLVVFFFQTTLSSIASVVYSRILFSVQ